MASAITIAAGTGRYENCHSSYECAYNLVPVLQVTGGCRPVKRVRSLVSKTQPHLHCSAQAQLSGTVPIGSYHKQSLLDSFWGTERGLTAAPETRVEINELISHLEAVNVEQTATDSFKRLGGRWKLVYTSNSELVSVLSLSQWPFVTDLELYQTIDCDASTVENAVTVTLPGSTVSIRSLASFKMLSSKRFGLNLSKPGKAPNVQVTAHVENQQAQSTIAAFTNAVKPLFETSSAAVDFVTGFLGPLNPTNKGISMDPSLELPVLSPRVDTWLITSYMDDDLCVRRGDGGSVFVLVRESMRVDQQ